MSKLQNNFTTPEQSKRLLELGVPAWTADCYYQESGKIEIKNTALDGLYPSCWSVGRLIEAKKLSLAEKLLRADLSVTEVCFRAGFSDCSRFILCFKKKFGKTPLKYKQELLMSGRL